MVGTGRLTFKKNIAIISQMTVQPEMQKTGIGSKILTKLIEIATTNHNISIIELSARTSAILFYKKFGFKPTGLVYASSKTGIPHQKMILSGK